MLDLPPPLSALVKGLEERNNFMNKVYSNKWVNEGNFLRLFVLGDHLQKSGPFPEIINN